MYDETNYISLLSYVLFIFMNSYLYTFRVDVYSQSRLCLSGSYFSCKGFVGVCDN